jgi:hypothetical protein
VFHSTYAKWIISDKDRDAVEAMFGEEMGAPDRVMGGKPQ